MDKWASVFQKDEIDYFKEINMTLTQSNLPKSPIFLRDKPRTWTQLTLNSQAHAFSSTISHFSI